MKQGEQIVDNVANVKSINRALIIASVIAGAVILVVIGTYFYHFGGSWSSSQSVWGAFGDYVGGILNPFIAFLALVAILATLSIQYSLLLITREQLEKTTEELSLSRFEMQASSEALQEQSTSLEQQNFENTYFQMLRFLAGRVSALKLVPDGVFHDQKPVYLGYDALNIISDGLKNRLKLELAHESQLYVGARLRSIYLEFMKKAGRQLIPYFDTLYLLLAYIDTNQPKNKALYLSILRSQLSTTEVTLLFYDALTKAGAAGLVTRTGMLVNIDASDLIRPEHTLTQYPKEAYGGHWPEYESN